MKNDIRNIINFEDLTRVRSSINVLKNIPAKDSLVKLIPIEYLNQGVKVLIDGKLFIAQIDEKIPVKEEIIAEVTSTNPFLLTLNLTEKLFKNKNFLLDQVIQKFDLPNTDSIRKLLVNVIGEENILIKSKILSIIDLLKNYPVKGLEFSLLVNLIWNNNDKQKIFIKDLYENLFDEPFEQVCENLFDSLKELLFTDMPNYLNQQISNSIIYNQKNDNSKFMANMPESILGLIKTLNDYKSKNKTFETTEIDNFIFHGTKYILQKSVLKEYDFYPDFVVVKNGSELNIINYSIKKCLM